MTDELTQVATWQTRGGKRWMVLERDAHGIYSIRGSHSGGVIGHVDESTAIADVQGRVDRWRMLDGINMRRVA